MISSTGWWSPWSLDLGVLKLDVTNEGWIHPKMNITLGSVWPATETINLSKRVEIIGQRVVFSTHFYRSRNLFATRAVTPAGLKYKCSFKALPHKLRFSEQKATVCPIKMKIHVMYGPKDILVTSPGSVSLAYLCYLALLNHFKHLKPFHMNSI